MRESRKLKALLRHVVHENIHQLVSQALTETPQHMNQWLVFAGTRRCEKCQGAVVEIPSDYDHLQTYQKWVKLNDKLGRTPPHHMTPSYRIEIRSLAEQKKKSHYTTHLDIMCSANFGRTFECWKCCYTYFECMDCANKMRFIGCQFSESDFQRPHPEHLWFLEAPDPKKSLCYTEAERQQRLQWSKIPVRLDEHYSFSPRNWEHMHNDRLCISHEERMICHHS
jgi:hypothetical protein